MNHLDKELTLTDVLEIIAANVVIVIVVSTIAVSAVAVAATATESSSSATSSAATTTEATTSASAAVVEATVIRALRGAGTAGKGLAIGSSDVLSAGTTVLSVDLELNLLANGQGAEAAGDDLKGGEVNKVLLLVNLILDEAEATASHPRDDLTLVAQASRKAEHF